MKTPKPAAPKIPRAPKPAAIESPYQPKADPKIDPERMLHPSFFNTKRK
jgi:hypothetical protein